jgi:hypothetical protein
MAGQTSDQVRSQWLLAGRLNGALSVVQMLVFAVILLRSSVVYASENFWGLILGFAITGVVATVCMSRVAASRRTPSK